MQVPPIFIGSYACTVHCIYTATFVYTVYYILKQLKIHILVYTVTTERGQKYSDTSNFPYSMYISNKTLEIFVSAKAELNVVFMCNFNINL